MAEENSTNGSKGSPQNFPCVSDIFSKELSLQQNAAV